MSITLQAPPVLHHLPVLYYNVIHNVTQSGSVQLINTTNTNIVLQGVEYGNTYSVTVYAVNAVGGGSEESKSLTGQNLQSEIKK